MDNWTGHLNDAEATHLLGARLGRAARSGWVVSLEGPLGSGKTTLAQGVAEGLDVAERLTSPTFVLESRYQGRLLLHHFDLYRFSEPPSQEELIEIGLTEAVFGEGVCVIEWADRLSGESLGACLRLRLAHATTGRQVEIADDGTVYCRFMEELRRERPGD